MSTPRTETEPRDMDTRGSGSSTLVACPDCSGGVYNLPNQRRKHLKWHDDLDADVASAQEAAQGAQEAAHAAETSLREARAEIAALLAQIGDSGRGEPTPILGDWPADEIAGRDQAEPEPATVTGREGEPDEDGIDEDLIDVSGLIVDEDDTDPRFPTNRFA